MLFASRDTTVIMHLLLNLNDFLLDYMMHYVIVWIWVLSSLDYWLVLMWIVVVQLIKMLQDVMFVCDQGNLFHDIDDQFAVLAIYVDVMKHVADIDQYFHCQYHLNLDPPYILEIKQIFFFCVILDVLQLD